MLQVAVHRDDRVARGEVEARRERDLVAEAPREPDDLDSAGPFACASTREPVRAVGRAVVDEDRLPRRAESVERQRQTVDEGRQHLLLVAERDDHGQPGRVALHGERE